MGAFSPTPTYITISPEERLRRAYDRALPFGEVFGPNFRAGIESSFGLGTAIREFSTPPLLDGMDIRRFRETPEEYAGRIFGERSRMLTEEQYKALPSYREGIPWEKGMTKERSAALALQYDRQQGAAWMASRNPVAGFVGQFAGQAFDPINYVPVFGPAAHAAIIAKAGGVFGRMGIAASEAAINTAAFGVLTADIRRSHGDEVSFQGILTEVAISALIGGAFGLGLGALAARGESRLKQAIRENQAGMKKVGEISKSLDILRKGADDIINKGFVDLGPNEAQTISTTAAEVVRRGQPAEALAKETEGVTARPGAREVYTPDGEVKVEAMPEIVELADLQRASGIYQVRDRIDRVESDRWIETTAADLNPALLMPEGQSDRGAPLVGSDGMVDSGNGRVAAIQRAYEAYPDKATAYKDALTKAGYNLEGMNQPVLIMRRMTELSPAARSAFNARSNASTAVDMSPAEIADMDALAMDDAAIALAEPGPVQGEANRAFVDSFMANLPRTQRGRLIDADGNLNKAGVERIENALVSAAYGNGDPLVVRRFAEATDDNSRSILGAMSDVAGQWARLQRAIKRGDVDPAFDPLPTLTDAIDKINRWRIIAHVEKRPVSTVIKEGLAQLDLIGGEIALPTKRMIEAFYKDESYRTAIGREAIGVLLSRIATNAEQLGQPQLFGRPGVSLEEVISHATGTEQADLFVSASDLGFSPRSISADWGATVRADWEASGSGPDAARAKGAPTPEGEVDGNAGRAGRGSARGVGVPAEPPPPPRSWRVNREADGTLRGLPRKIGSYTASVFTKAQDVAQAYMKKAGLEYRPPYTYAKVDPARAARIADAYDAMVHAPNDPEVRAAYDAMIVETKAQYQAMLDSGIKVEFNPPGQDPYKGNPRNMTEDVRNNNHMWVFPTVEGFGSDVTVDVADNPLLADSGFMFGDKPATVNDVFRAVHDYFGHVKEGVGFRADGEENAWRSHSAMYSPLARRAMTSETRGQNSWVNFGPFGESNRSASSENTHYADQKIGLLPDWVVNEGAGDAISDTTGFDLSNRIETPAQQQQTFAGIAGAERLPAKKAAIYRYLDAEDKEEFNRQKAYEETGIFRGIDGKLRFEIKDSVAHLDTAQLYPITRFVDRPAFTEGMQEIADNADVGISMKAQVAGVQSPLTLGEVLPDHMILYDAYPEARKLPVKLILDPDMSIPYGGYWDGTNIVALAKDANTLRSVVLHELQHVIQRYEDFSAGGNTRMGRVYEGPRVDAAREQLTQVRNKIKELEDKAIEIAGTKGMDSPEYEATIKLVDGWRPMEYMALDEVERAAGAEFYLRLAGEVEARNVQYRDKMRREDGMPESLMSPPWITADRREAVQVSILASTRDAGRQSMFDLASAVEPDRIEEGQRLPFILDRYFTKPDDAIDVPIEQLTATRQRPSSAASKMVQAYNGDTPKREPIALKMVGPDQYEIRDGNSTYGVAVENGWPAIRAEVLTDAEWDARQIVKKAQDAARKEIPEIGTSGKIVDFSAMEPDVQFWFQNAMREAQPHQSMDDIYGVAQKWQDELTTETARLREELGLPPAAKITTTKARAASEEKLIRKGYTSVRQLTDVVRDGIAVNTPEQADEIVKALAKKWNIIDEGWNVTRAGYFDRKAMVQFPDGTIGELQLYHPEILRAKKEVGHLMYEEWRSQQTAPERKAELLPMMRYVYGSALRVASPEWKSIVGELIQEAEGGMPTPGANALNVSAETSLPLSITSEGSTGVQSAPGERIAQADEPSPSTTAGRPSQLKNQTVSMGDYVGQMEFDLKPAARGVDLTKPRPEPIPDDLADAEASVGKGENMKEAYARFGLNEDGSFDELEDIAQMKDEGRLDAVDEMELEAADRDLKNANAFQKALKAAVACVT